MKRLTALLGIASICRFLLKPEVPSQVSVPVFGTVGP
jgi:hypothetical protein